jgi:two-component sensor histidine kinase
MKKVDEIHEPLKKRDSYAISLLNTYQMFVNEVRIIAEASDDLFPGEHDRQIALQELLERLEGSLESV